MSSFICFSTDEFAVVATDTLGVDAEGNPFILTNKATYLPTIKTIICGTGMGGFHSRWAEFVNSRMILLDVDNLDWICPYISRHLLSLNPLLARCRRYSRGER